MKIFDFIQLDNPQEIVGIPIHYQILPDDCVVLQNILQHGDINFNPSQLPQGLKKISTNARYIFIDASFDTVAFSDLEIQLTIELVTQQFANSKTVFLSGKCSHYFSQHHNILWYPTFLLLDYPTQPRARQKRMGCLNRRNAPHRIWLMHNLLSRGFLDHTRDIFSVSFVHFLEKQHRADVDSWLATYTNINSNHNNIIAQYPDSIATIPDNFSKNQTIDMSTDHPAWHTAITIITETECAELSMISEKTVKALAAECCWISYTGNDNIQVLDALGFEARLFTQHSADINIDPIVQVCRTIDTETMAMDYYHSRLAQIQHNKQHLEHGWINQYLPKLQQALDSL